MRSGFDIEYCRSIAKQSARDPNSSSRSLPIENTTINSIRGFSVCLIQKSDKKPVRITEIGSQVVSKTIPFFMDEAGVTSLNQINFDGSSFDYLMNRFESEVDDNNIVWFVAETPDGVKFRYASQAAVSYLSCYVRDSLRQEINARYHTPVDNFPRWFGEKTPKQEHESVMEVHNKIPSVVLPDFNLSMLKVPVSFEKTYRAVPDSNGDFELVLETHAVFRMNGKKHRISPKDISKHYSESAVITAVKPESTAEYVYHNGMRYKKAAPKKSRKKIGYK